MDTAHSRDGDRGEAKCWFVRNEQGRRFGPADLATLQGWARDGRIGPLNEVSCDGVSWSLACAMPEMEMDWVAALAPGNYYGPIHAGAMRGLLADGSINADAALFRRDRLDADVKQAAAEDLAALRAQTDQLRGLAAERKAEAESLRVLAAERKAEAESLRGRLKQTEEKARLEIARVREQERRRTEEIEQAAEELRRLMREQAEQAREQRSLDAARYAAIEDELGKTRRDLSEAVSRYGRQQSEAENLGRLRAEERIAYEKCEMAAQEEARRAVAREAELGACIKALEEDLAAARMQAGTRGAVADAGAPGGTSVDVDGTDAEYVEAEPLGAADALKIGNKRKSVVEEAELLPPDAGAPERSDRFGHKTAAGAGPRRAAGLSMAALEAQARRELELLGSGAKMFFSKGKK